MDALNLQLLQRNPLLPLPTLFGVEQHSPYYHEEGEGSIFYAESWALTRYLKIKDSLEGTNRTGDYLDLVQKKVDPVSAATQVFGDLDQLQAELKKYVVNGEYSDMQVSGSMDVDSSSFVVSTMTRSQANVARADFLAHDGRLNDSKALLNTILREQPTNVPALEIMGYASIREHKLDEARQWCEKALKLDAQSFMANSCFGLSSMEQWPTDASGQTRIENSLRAAINPSFSPAYAGLGEFFAHRGQNDEALQWVQKAVQLDPGVVEFRIDEANILLHMNKINEGIEALNLALKMAHTPEETAAVEEVLRSAKKYQVAQKQFQNQKPTVRLQGAPSGASGTGTAMTPPKPIYSPQVEYTEAARQARLEGVSGVSLIVGVDGKPSNIVVVKRLGMGLDEKAVEAIQKWRFEPARRYGQPVPARLNLNLTFKLFGLSDKFLERSEKAKAGDPAAEFELAKAFFEGREFPKTKPKDSLCLKERARWPTTGAVSHGRTHLW